MVPEIGKAPFDRTGWIFELKYDGYRAIIEIQVERAKWNE
jgi:ATP-dependent DNA ligase